MNLQLNDSEGSSASLASDASSSMLVLSQSIKGCWPKIEASEFSTKVCFTLFHQAPGLVQPQTSCHIAFQRPLIIVRVVNIQLESMRLCPRWCSKPGHGQKCGNDCQLANVNNPIQTTFYKAKWIAWLDSITTTQLAVYCKDISSSPPPHFLCCSIHSCR